MLVYQRVDGSEHIFLVLKKIVLQWLQCSTHPADALAGPVEMYHVPFSDPWDWYDFTIIWNLHLAG